MHLWSEWSFHEIDINNYSVCSFSLWTNERGAAYFDEIENWLRDIITMVRIDDGQNDYSLISSDSNVWMHYDGYLLSVSFFKRKDLAVLFKLRWI